MASHDQGFYLNGTLDPSGAIKELNGQGLTDSKLNGENLTGRDFFFLAGEGPQRRSLEEALEKAAVGQAASVEVEFGEASKNAQRLKFTFTPINTETGEVKNMFFTAQDIGINNLKKNVYKNRSEQLLRAAETAAVGLFFWDLGGDDLVTTSTFNEFYGIAP